MSELLLPTTDGSTMDDDFTKHNIEHRIALPSTQSTSELWINFHEKWELYGLQRARFSTPGAPRKITKLFKNLHNKY